MENNFSKRPENKSFKSLKRSWKMWSEFQTRKDKYHLVNHGLLNFSLSKSWASIVIDLKEFLPILLIFKVLRNSDHSRISRSKIFQMSVWFSNFLCYWLFITAKVSVMINFCYAFETWESWSFKMIWLLRYSVSKSESLPNQIPLWKSTITTLNLICNRLNASYAKCKIGLLFRNALSLNVGKWLQIFIR